MIGQPRETLAPNSLEISVRVRNWESEIVNEWSCEWESESEKASKWTSDVIEWVSEKSVIVIKIKIKGRAKIKIKHK